MFSLVSIPCFQIAINTLDIVSFYYFLWTQLFSSWNCLRLVCLLCVHLIESMKVSLPNQIYNGSFGRDNWHFVVWNLCSGFYQVIGIFASCQKHLPKGVNLHTASFFSQGKLHYCLSNWIRLKLHKTQKMDSMKESALAIYHMVISYSLKSSTLVQIQPFRMCQKGFIS